VADDPYTIRASADVPEAPTRPLVLTRKEPPAQPGRTPGGRVVLVVVGLVAWLGLQAIILASASFLTATVAHPIAELMQQTGGLDPDRFGRVTWPILIVVGVAALGGTVRKAQGRRHPWWYLLTLLLVGLVLFLLLLGIWIEGEQPPGALVVAAGQLCLVGVAMVAPVVVSIAAGRWVVGRAKAEWNRGDWPVSTTLTFCLCGAAPAGLVVALVALDAEGHDSEEPTGAWVNADGFMETTRLLLAELAYDQVGHRSERRIPGMEAREGVHYSASGAVRRRPYASDRWSCHTELTYAPDPSHPSKTSRDLCVERLRRAGHYDPEGEADKRVDKVCEKVYDEPVQVYSKACTNAIKDIRRSPTWTPPEPVQAEPDRWLLRHCLQAVINRDGRISDREWRPVLLRADGADYSEIAAELGTTEANARQIVSRTTRKLREVCGDLY
jgi:DNA-directed RNA polymerase specialized sigma24 family protein